jgi:peptidoglycan/LPS O-acetylase OafA/YrhL
MNKRNRTVDFLRCIAILLILVDHIFLTRPVSNKNFFLQKIYLLSNGGRIGVDLFFVLSGFLISGLIFKEHKQYEEFRPIRFLIRRGFKIYPLYYILILLGIFFYPLILHQPFFRTDLLAELFFVVNYWNSGNPPLGHLWSISVEEHFYFFLSLFLFLLIKFNKLSFTILLRTYLLIFIIGFVFRTINFYQYNGSWWKVFSLSHNRFDSLFFGVLLSYTYLYKRQLLKFITDQGSLIFIVSICIILLNFSLAVSWNVKSIFLLGINPICFGLIMIILVENKKFEDNKLIRPFAFVGQHSYSIYIFHPLIMYSVKEVLVNAPFLFYTLSFSLSICFGIILSKLIEIPFLKIRDKFFPSRAQILLKPSVILVSQPKCAKKYQ